MWINGLILYKQNVIRRMGPSRKTSAQKEVLKPNYIGLNDEMSDKIEIKFLFN